MNNYSNRTKAALAAGIVGTASLVGGLLYMNRESDFERQSRLQEADIQTECDAFREEVRMYKAEMKQIEELTAMTERLSTKLHTWGASLNDAFGDGERFDDWLNK